MNLASCHLDFSNLAVSVLDVVHETRDGFGHLVAYLHGVDMPHYRHLTSPHGLVGYTGS